MKIVYFDWSIRNGVFTLTNDGDEVVVYPNLRALIDTLDPGDTLIGEATFESFNLEQRYRLIAMAEALGIHFLTTPTRLTGRTRRSLGFVDKSDSIDVRVIREVAQHPSRLKPPLPADPAWVERRQRANRKLMGLRRSGELTPKVRTPGRFNFTSQKDLQAAEWAAKLPPYLDQPTVRQLALGNGKDWNYVIVAAVGVAATEARNAAEFDRLAGLYAHAYPSQIRADLHHYAWAGGNTRAKLEQKLVDGHRVLISPSRRIDGLTWTDYRRELRWLYHHLRPIVV